MPARHWLLQDPRPDSICKVQLRRPFIKNGCRRKQDITADKTAELNAPPH